MVRIDWIDYQLVESLFWLSTLGTIETLSPYRLRENNLTSLAYFQHQLKSYIFFSLIFDIWSSNPLTRLVSGRGSETARGRVTEFPWIRVFFGLTVNTAENDRHFPRQPTPINSGFGGITFVSSISGIAEVHCLCVIEKKVSIFKLKSKVHDTISQAWYIPVELKTD